MTPEEYNQILHDINNQIEVLQKSRAALIAKNQEDIKKQIEKRQADDRKWFVQHFDIFLTHRHQFGKNTKNADIIIDFFNLYTKGNKAGRKFFHYLTISDLITLWNLGYQYQGHPIVEYVDLTVSRKLTYIKNKKLVTVSDFNEKTLGFSPILCAILEYLCAHKTISSSFEEYKTLQEMKNILEN